jgi:hypothetical protein
MNLLFYVEPLIEREQPYWKEGWANEACWNIITTLHQAYDTYRFELITNEAIAQTIDPNKELSVHVISQKELLKPFDTNYLSATRSWHLRTYTQKQLEYYQNLMQSKLGDFVPEIIITFTPVSFLQTLFPDALVLHHEFSIFSRLPYPASWFLDPVGVSCDSFLNRFSEEISGNTLSAKEKQQLDDFKSLCQDTLQEKSPFGSLLAKEKEKFDFLVLLPLQFSGYYLFDDLVPFKTQYEYCVYVLDSVPESVGIVVNMHPEYPVLSDGAIKFLTSKYPHFIYLDDFNSIYASGQFILPFIDGVVSVSSSIALQALLFDKKIITLGESCFRYAADATSLEGIENILTHSSKNKDTILYYLLTHYAVTSEYLSDSLWLDTFLKRSLNHFRTDGIKFTFYELIDETDVVFGHLHASLIKNSFIVPQYIEKVAIQLFFDYGMGISDKDFLSIHVGREKIQTFHFDLSCNASLHSLRLDPLEESCIIELKSFVLVTEEGEIDVCEQIYSNACFVDGKKYFFESKDPQLFFIPENQILLNKARELIVVIDYLHVGRDALEYILNQQIKLVSSKEEEIHLLQETLQHFQQEAKHFQQEAKHFQQEFFTLLQSRSWQITAPLRAIGTFSKRYLSK